jgi:predicted phosphodiesterase
MAKRVGLISDIHSLLREAALKAMAGSDLIIHAGDIGKLEVLEALRAQSHGQLNSSTSWRGSGLPELASIHTRGNIC